MFINFLLCARQCVKLLGNPTLWSICFYLHFIREESEAHEGHSLPLLTQIVIERLGIEALLGLAPKQRLFPHH